MANVLEFSRGGGGAEFFFFLDAGAGETKFVFSQRPGFKWFNKF